MKFNTLMLTMALVAIFAVAAVSAAIYVQDQESDQQQSGQQEAAEEQQEAAEETKDEVLRRIVGHAQNGEFETAIEQAEAYLAKQDDDDMSMILLRLITMHADYLAIDDRKAANPQWYRAGKMIREFADKGLLPDEAKPNVAFMIYNEAASHALDGNRQAAMESLEDTFEWGFEDYEKIANDPHFESLAEDAEFKNFIEGQKELILKRIEETTKEELAQFESFDFDFDLTTVAGESVKLSDYEGQVIIVDFWGTWCGPCIQEIPSFIKLKKELNDKDFDIVGLNYEHGEDEEENTENVKTFIDELKINYSCALIDEEILEQVPEFQGFPTTLFIDRDGDVRMMLVGLHRYDKLKSVVTQLLAE